MWIRLKNLHIFTHTHTRKGEPFISFIMINFFLCFLKVKSCKKTVLNSMNVINFGVWKSAFSSLKKNEILKEWFILNHVLSCWLYSIIFCNYKNAWEKCVWIDFFLAHLYEKVLKVSNQLCQKCFSTKALDEFVSEAFVHWNLLVLL